MKGLKLGNKTYSHKKGTYNAMWNHSDGSPAFWGSYNPDDGSYYLATAKGTIAAGMWLQNGDYEFQSCGTYSFDAVRRAIQLGIF